MRRAALDCDTPQVVALGEDPLDAVASAPVTRIAPTFASTIALIASNTVASPAIRIRSPPFSARIFATSAIARLSRFVRHRCQGSRDVETALPPGRQPLCQDGDQRRRRDQLRRRGPPLAATPRSRLGVQRQDLLRRRRPRAAVEQHERAVGQLAERCRCAGVAPGSRRRRARRAAARRSRRRPRSRAAARASSRRSGRSPRGGRARRADDRRRTPSPRRGRTAP